MRDDMLLERPFADGEDKDIILWQVLLHVGKHGTEVLGTSGASVSFRVEDAV
jgi:hypothetical protein